MSEEFALVRCAGCGEFVTVAWELLGDTDPRSIDDYVCGACEQEDQDWIDEQDYDDDIEDSDDDEFTA